MTHFLTKLSKNNIQQGYGRILHSLRRHLYQNAPFFPQIQWLELFFTENLNYEQMFSGEHAKPLQAPVCFRSHKLQIKDEGKQRTRWTPKLTHSWTSKALLSSSCWQIPSFIKILEISGILGCTWYVQQYKLFHPGILLMLSHSCQS